MKTEERKVIVEKKMNEFKNVKETGKEIMEILINKKINFRGWNYINQIINNEYEKINQKSILKDTLN